MRCDWCGKKIKKGEKWVTVQVAHPELFKRIYNVDFPAVLHRGSCLKHYEQKVILKIRKGGCHVQKSST